MLIIAFRILVVLIAVALSAGCQQHRDGKPSTATAARPTAKNTIPWFKGSVKQAFETARTEGKPIFLYWGAVWCPPCEEVRNTVFKSEQFIALSQLFIPVFIDGDSDRAQAIGEKFGVRGYPTMIVFNPAGDEITRIPGGIDVSRYNSVLQLSLNRLKPTRQLLHEALADPSALRPADFTQLAYYSWDQDHDVLPKDASVTLFERLSELARPHDKVAAARLFMQYLVQASQKDRRKSGAHIDGAYETLSDILNSDKLILACWDSLAYYPEIAKLVAAGDDQRNRLQQRWQARVMALRHDPSLATAEQLAGWLPYVYFHFQSTKDPLPKDKSTAMEEDIVAADRATTNPFARQAVVDQIAYVYTEAHRFDEARATLLAELDKAAAPWYFMSDLASLAEQQHKNDEAIRWYRQAYDESKGEATRFQWGASYVRSLIRLDPDNHVLILSATQSLLGELKGPDDIFTGRNYRVLRRLDEKLKSWQGPDTKAQLRAGFTTPLNRLCDKEAAGSMAKQNCDRLLKGGSA